MTKVQDLFDLTGKVALVTGGSRGLGLELAEGLGEAGAKIAITARRDQWLTPAAEELTKAGIECYARTADVSKSESVAEMVADVLGRFGQIDILINNAGISWGQAAEEMPLERWQQVVDTNLTGMFLVSQAVGKSMIARGGSGAIINVASVAGLAGGDPGIMKAVAYHASKGGAIAFTKDLAAEWGAYNIRVNAIAPGYFPTRMASAVIERGGERITGRAALGRVGRPGELKATGLFLASAASSFITGQVIVVDGGTV